MNARERQAGWKKKEKNQLTNILDSHPISYYLFGVRKEKKKRKKRRRKSEEKENTCFALSQALHWMGYMRIIAYNVSHFILISRVLWLCSVFISAFVYNAIANLFVLISFALSISLSVSCAPCFSPSLIRFLHLSSPSLPYCRLHLYVIHLFCSIIDAVDARNGPVTFLQFFFTAFLFRT